MSSTAPVAFDPATSANRLRSTCHARQASAAASPAHDRLAERIGQALTATGYAALRRLTIHIDGTSVALHGQAPSYYLKQVAQTVVQRIEGVEHVENEIRVDNGRL